MVFIGQLSLTLVLEVCVCLCFCSAEERLKNYCCRKLVGVRSRVFMRGRNRFGLHN